MIKNKIVKYALFLLILTTNVAAIGISPSRTIISFEPNLEQTITYTVYNNANTEVNVDTYIKGDLANYTKLNTNSLLVKAQSTNTFAATIKLPQTLTRPGIHDTRIGAVESTGATKGTGTFVGAITGVEAQLFVQVPYPGKYASIDLEVPDVVLNQPINFKVNINNLGDENINSAYAIIDVFDPNNAKITTIQTETTSIESKQSASLYAYWIPTNVKAGVYKAAVILYYDGLTSNTDKQFKIGDLIINLNKFSATYSPINKIVKFDIELESLWNQQIDNVFGKITIKKDFSTIDNVNTETVSIGPWGTKAIATYHPVEGYADGTYNADLEIRYANKTLNSSTTFDIITPIVTTNDIIYGIIIGLVIIVIILLIILITVKGKNENQ